MATITRAFAERGAIAGTRQGPLHVFTGIPFAKPPVGPLRLRPPEPPEHWRGDLRATSFAPAAPQPTGIGAAAIFADIARTSEDCLYLNVWSPDLEGRRPVLVWIHGGAFVFGAGSQRYYAGSTLAEQHDVVVVTLNYRLGALGFCFLPAVGSAPGTANCGIQDQVAALEWVRDNIEAFGGDPHNVTLFGESAGAMSVATLMSLRSARGLFHRAILQSGAAQVCRTAEEGLATSAALLDELGLTTRTHRLLAGIPASEVVAAQARVMERRSEVSLLGTSLLSFCPVVDGEVVPDPPLDAISGGASAGVDIVCGTNMDETKLFGLQDAGLASIDYDQVVKRVASVIGDETRAELVAGAYRESRGARAAASDLWTAIGTDYVFRIPAIRLAETQAAHGRVYSYVFAWRPPALEGSLGASHTVEVPFVWGTLGLPGVRDLLGDGPEARGLARSVQEAWCSFARSGEPSSPGMPQWPSYEPATRSTMVLDTTCRVEDDPQSAERRAWADLI